MKDFIKDYGVNESSNKKIIALLIEKTFYTRSNKLLRKFPIEEILL